MLRRVNITNHLAYTMTNNHGDSSSSYFKDWASSGEISKRFPNCKTILWDKQSIGTNTESSFSFYKDISLNLIERSLRLAYKGASVYFKTNKKPLYRGLFLGSLSCLDSDDEIKIVVNRFDPGICHLGEVDGSHNWPLPSSKLPDDLVIPVLMVNRSAMDQSSSSTNELVAKSVKAIEEYMASSSNNLRLQDLFKCFCVCYYTDQFGELTFEMSWNLIAPGASFNMKPVTPVPIIPTALARNLSGPLNLTALQNGAKFGFLTMDQTRKLLLLLESDPKVASLPVVGVWISGVMSSCDTNVWAALARYQKSNRLANKQCDGSNGFLAMCYMSTEKNPLFFDCTEIEAPNAYKVFQCQEELNLFKESNSKADSTFIYFPLSMVEVSPMHQIADITLRTISSSTRLMDSNAPLFGHPEMSSIGPCSPIITDPSPPCPQSAPVPHAAHRHRFSINESVPEVSVWEPQHVANQMNKSDSMEQDQGFFSKSSSDHDSSLERMVVYTKRLIANQPLETIESSANVTERSSSHTSVQRTNRSIENFDRNMQLQNNHEDPGLNHSHRSVTDHSQCASCKSDKHELNTSLEQQRKQLELLQNQIQTLLKAQNIPIPEHINRTVVTRSAQTSPAESTNVSKLLQSSSNQFDLTASQRVVSRDEETWASIDPNSVPLQEDNLSHDNLVISHVQMPSFVDSECDNTTVESEMDDGDRSRYSDGSWENRTGVNTEVREEEMQVVNCLNSVMFEEQQNPMNSDSRNQSLLMKQQQIEKLNQQIANALVINSPVKESSNNENREPKPKERQVAPHKGKQSKEVREKNLEVDRNPESFMNHQANQERFNVVDLSMAANSIAMKYHQSDRMAHNGIQNWDVSSTSFMCEYSYLPHLAVTESYRSSGFRDHSMLPNSELFDERGTNLSFATEQYLAKHGMLSYQTQASSSKIVKESRRVSNPNPKKSSLEPQNVAANEIRKQSVGKSSRSKEHQTACYNPASYDNGPKDSRCLESEDEDSDSEFNILDMDKLRSLPKLL